LKPYLEGQKNQEGYVQVTKIQEKNSKYVITLSDGGKSAECALSSQKNSIVTQGEIEVGSIIEVPKYNVATIQGKRMIIVLDVEVAQKECEVLGSPTPTNQSAVTQPPRQAQSQSKRRSLNMLSSAGSGGNGEFIPISGLTPYGGTQHSIKVRVTDKQDVRTWKNDRGEGKLFSFVVMDKAGTEMRVTAFKEECDKFAPIIQEEKTYVIRKFRVKADNYRKGRVQNEYAITLQRDTIIEEIQESKQFAQKQVTFTTIADLENIQLEEKESKYVDMMCYVREIGELQNITSRAGKELTKRDLTLGDHTNLAISCTLWGQTAEQNDSTALPPGTIICLPNCRVSTFGGRSLSAGSIKTSNLENYGDVYQQILQSSQGGIGQELKKLTVRGGFKEAERMCWDEALEQQKGVNVDNSGDYKGDWFQITGCVSFIPHSFEKPPWYNAVPEGDSKGKVTENGDGTWTNLKTGDKYDTYKPRYVLRLRISDFSGGEYCSAFNEEATEFLGISAEDLETFVKNGNEDGFEKPFTDAMFKPCNVKIKAKEDTYQGQSRVKYTIQELKEFDYVAESQKLFEEVHTKWMED